MNLKMLEKKKKKKSLERDWEYLWDTEKEKLKGLGDDEVENIGKSYRSWLGFWPGWLEGCQ